MGVLIIAKKEFRELVINPFLFVCILLFIIYIIINIYKYYNISSGVLPNTRVAYDDEPFLAISSFVFWPMKVYGAILGTVIGCTSISNERFGNALNTLLVKPIYRDTIINGKFLGVFGFTALSLTFIMTIYSAIMLCLYGNSIISHMGSYLIISFAMLFVIFIYVMVFIAFSMLLSILTKNQAFPFIFSLIFIYLLNLAPTVNFSENLSVLLPLGDGDSHGVVNTVLSSLPDGIIRSVQAILFNMSYDANDWVTSILSNLVKLLVYVVTILFIDYTLFVRRDIT